VQVTASPYLSSPLYRAIPNNGALPHFSPIGVSCKRLLGWMGCIGALALTFAGGAKHASVFCGEGKLELTESAREFQKGSAPQNRLARSGGEEETGPDTPCLLLLLRLQQLLPFFEHPKDCL